MSDAMRAIKQGLEDHYEVICAIFYLYNYMSCGHSLQLDLRYTQPLKICLLLFFI